MPEIGSLKNVATISQIALPTAKRRGVQITPVTSHGTHGYHFRQHLPSDARQPSISSFSAPSYTETSKMPFLIVSDTLYPATDMRTGHVTSSVCRCAHQLRSEPAARSAFTFRSHEEHGVYTSKGQRSIYVPVLPTQRSDGLPTDVPF